MKVIFRFFSLLLFIFFALSIFYLWQTRAQQSSNFLSKATGIDFSMESLDPFLWGAKIQGLEIANPPGSKKQRALLVRDFSLSLVPTSFFSNTLKLTNLSLEGLELYIDLQDVKGKKSNWESILKPSKSSAAKSKKDSNQVLQARKILIKNLDLKDLKITIRHPLLGKSKHHIDHVNLKNVDQEASLATVIEFVFKAVISQAGTKLPNMEGLLKKGIKLPANAIKSLLPESDNDDNERATSPDESQNSFIEEIPEKMMEQAKKLFQ